MASIRRADVSTPSQVAPVRYEETAERISALPPLLVIPGRAASLRGYCSVTRSL